MREKVSSAPTAIGYEGHAVVRVDVDLPSPGCWRLMLRTGDLEAQVDLQAVRLAP